VKSIEPSLTFSTAAAATQGTVSVVVSSTSGTLNDIVTLGTQSASGTCFYIKDVASGATAGTFYGSDTTCTTVATAATSAKW
jgi:hypothetical protein